MSVKIRLRRMGKRNEPCHRIVVTDSRSPRDGRFIEAVGAYDARRKWEQLDLERVEYWMGNGAKPSETVATIIKRARAGMLRQGTTSTEPVREEPAEETESVEEPVAAQEEAEAEHSEGETTESSSTDEEEAGNDEASADEKQE